MFKTRLFLISVLSLSAIMMRANSMQRVEIINNHAKKMLLKALNEDNSFGFNLAVPEYAKAVVVAKVVSLKDLQSQLLQGIRNNSVREIEQAIADGADVNAVIEGQTPMAWAMALCKADAIVCLINHSAR